MKGNFLKELLGFAVFIAGIITIMILTGIWIPKVCFFPKRAPVRLHYEARMARPGFLISNTGRLGLRNLTVDINGSSFKEGYTSEIKFLPGGGESYWIGFNKIRKNGTPLKSNIDVSTIEVYGEMGNWCAYRKFRF